MGKRFPMLAMAALTPILGGCSYDVLDPAGMIGEQNRSTLYWATGLMLIVVIPVIWLTLQVAWKYRASNQKAAYDPEWSHSTAIEVVVWTVPTIIVAALAWICIETSHTLDPYRPIASTRKPVEVQVVALDWKWLFVYPEFGVASVNELAMPVGRPVNFKITSASVMNSFFVPRLGTQVYAMNGMATKLHLIADEPGAYEGISANFSGDGFSDMRFKALAVDERGFADWIARAKAAPARLDQALYKQLEQPSERVAVSYYGQVTPTLFHDVLMQNMPMREDTTIVPTDAHDTPTHGEHAGQPVAPQKAPAPVHTTMTMTHAPKPLAAAPAQQD